MKQAQENSACDACRHKSKVGLAEVSLDVAEPFSCALGVLRRANQSHNVATLDDYARVAWHLLFTTLE